MRYLYPCLLLLLLPLLAVISCSDDSGPATPGDTRLDLELGASQAPSAGRVALTGIPDDVEDLYAEIRVGGEEPAGIAFIERADIGDSLIVPLHPQTPLTGGDVTLVVTDGGEVASEPLNLAIQALPPAPGAFAAVVDGLQGLLDAALSAQGTTRQELRESAADEISLVHLPLLLAHDVIDRPDNLSSLRAWADGTEPDLPGGTVAPELLDRLVARMGLDDYIARMTAFAEEHAPPAAALASMRSEVVKRQDGCIDGPDFGIGPDDGELLAEIMSYQADLDAEARSATQQLRDDAAAVIFTALGFTPAAEFAAGVSATLWAADVIQQGSRQIYPADFVSERTDFTATVLQFPEDFVEDGSWDDFQVTATSRGWRFDALIFQALLQILGAAGGSVDNVLGHLQEGREGVGEAIDGTITTVTNFVVTASTEAIVGELAGDSGTILEVCPQTWADIDCTDPALSRATSDELLLDQQGRTYRPRELGAARLTVETRDVFGLGNRTAETKEIVTDPIVVHIDPFAANVEIDTEVEFSVRVENAVNTDVTWWTEGSAPQLWSYDDAAATLTTPEEPWSPAIEVWARSLAATGLREGLVDSDPRQDVAEVSNQSASVLVEPLSFCVEPGESLPLSVAVIGSESDEVTWSTIPAGLGSFEANTWIAPEVPTQSVVLIATSVANPEVEGYTQGVVGTCQCYWTASVTGADFYRWAGEGAIWFPAETALPWTRFVFDPSAGASEGPPIISAAIDADIADGAIGTWDVLPISVIETGNSQEGYIAGDPDTDEMPTLTLFTNNGIAVEGAYSGPFYRTTPGGDFVTIHLELRFRASRNDVGCGD